MDNTVHEVIYQLHIRACWLHIMLSVFNPFKTNGIFHSDQLDCKYLFSGLLCGANIRDPKQSPHSTSSDLGLNCFLPQKGMAGLNGLKY